MDGEKKYIFQCLLCPKESNWHRADCMVRVWEKQIPYEKDETEPAEKEGELVLCVECYNKLK